MYDSQNQQQNTFEQIYHIVKQIPPGTVATYGQIATMVQMGLPAHIVGYALHGLKDGTDVPWHRVINQQGKITYSPVRNEHDSLQRKLLENEGIIFTSEETIDLKKYLWHP